MTEDLRAEHRKVLALRDELHACRDELARVRDEYDVYRDTVDQPIGVVVDDVIELREQLTKVRERCNAEAGKYKTGSVPESYSAYQEGKSDFADEVLRIVDGEDA